MMSVVVAQLQAVADLEDQELAIHQRQLAADYWLLATDY
jgi:hypothetical protein